MQIETQLFGTIAVEDDKVITFSEGIIGFPELKRFTLIVDEDNADSAKVFWLQSLDEGSFAMPVVDPFVIFDEYNPVVEDEWFKSLGEHTEDDLLVFLTLVVPEDVTEMTVNQKAPIVINTNTSNACQIIVEGDEYQIRYPIYDILKAKNEKAGD